MEKEFIIKVLTEYGLITIAKLIAHDKIENIAKEVVLSLNGKSRQVIWNKDEQLIQSVGTGFEYHAPITYPNQIGYKVVFKPVDSNRMFYVIDTLYDFKLRQLWSEEALYDWYGSEEWLNVEYLEIMAQADYNFMFDMGPFKCCKSYLGKPELHIRTLSELHDKFVLENQRELYICQPQVQ